MLKKLLSVRVVLTFLLFLSVVFAAWSVYYKVTVWGFSVKPKQISDIWTIEAHVSFMADGEPVKVLLSVPTENREFKIFSEDVVAEGYKTKYLGGGIRYVSMPDFYLSRLRCAHGAKAIDFARSV